MRRLPNTLRLPHTSSDEACFAIPEKMASQIRPYLTKVKTPQYIRFLHMMHHFMLKSGARLQFAANISTDSELRQVFQSMAEESAQLHTFIRRDLYQFGRHPISQPMPFVDQFNSYFMDTKRSQYELLGIVFALKTVGGHIQCEVNEMVQRINASTYATRFITDYARTNNRYAALIRELVSRNWNEHQLEIKTGVETAIWIWMNMHLYSFAEESLETIAALG